MNRGSHAINYSQLQLDEASMRPRFMNRGSVGAPGPLPAYDELQ